jgi:hypothetical protein
MESRTGWFGTLRDRPLGKVLILGVVIVVALIVARSCGKTEPELSQDEAIEIAEAQVAFDANQVVVRFLKQGLPAQEIWLVGLGERNPDGTYAAATNVLLDADTGEVLEIRQVAAPG